MLTKLLRLMPKDNCFSLLKRCQFWSKPHLVLILQGDLCTKYDPIVLIRNIRRRLSYSNLVTECERGLFVDHQLDSEYFTITSLLSTSHTLQTTATSTRRKVRQELLHTLTGGVCILWAQFQIQHSTS